MKERVVIVAFDLSRGIGRNGDMPWSVPGEMARAARITRGTRDPGRVNALVMGRITYESLPPSRRPLAGRKNYVISTRTRSYPGAVAARSLAEALALAEADPEVETIYLFGGESVYRRAFAEGVVDRVDATQIQQEFSCDRFFPELPESFHLVSEEPASYGGVEVLHQIFSGADARSLETSSVSRGT